MNDTKKTTLDFRQSTFVLTAPHTRFLPEDTGAEVAFVGRSNVGKSSALNVVCYQNQLARVSRSPGRTQAINVFEIENGKRLIDLPGYGYAAVPIPVRNKWQQLMKYYLAERQSLKGLMVLIDSRRGITPLDETLLRYVKSLSLPVHLLLTKIDTLSRNEAKQAEFGVAARAKVMLPNREITIIPFSSRKKIGIEALQACIEQWLKN